MVNAQEWLDKKYPKEKRSDIKLLVIDGKNLKGGLKLEGFSELEMFECFKNELTNLLIIDCPKIRHLNISCNLFENFDFLDNLDPEKLVFLSVHSNNFPEQDLSIFSKFTKLEELYVGNSDEDKMAENIYNRFHGSLLPLKDLKNLKFLSISNTDVSVGLEYLSENLKKISCRGEIGKKCLEIKKILETAANFEGVKEELVKEEEGDTKWSRYWYRLAPWHRYQDLLLEKKPLVQKLREQLEKNEQTILELKEKLEKKQSEHDELQKKLDLAVKEEEIKKMQEKDNRIKELEELVNNLMAHNIPPITISSNFSNTANFSNQVIYQVQYNDELLKKELAELKQRYRVLEPTNEPFSDPQKLKRVILFLATKQIFATTRQATINSLITTYEGTDKFSKKYNKIALVGDYIDNFGEIVSIVPGGSIVVKVLSKGIPMIANLLKSRSLTTYSQEFGNYLIEDEKTLLLLEQTYQSLVISKDDGGKVSSILVNLLKLNQGQFSQHSVFEVSKLQKEKKLTSDEMSQTIELLANHLKEFATKLRQETNQYAEKMEALFTETGGEILQSELTELLEKIAGKESSGETLIDQQGHLQKQITDKEIHLKELINSIKDKLKSNSILSSVKQERSEKLASLFRDFSFTPEEFIKKLEGIRHGLSKKLTEHEIKAICQTSNELGQLQIELKNLQGQQSQIQIPPKYHE